MGYRSDVAMCLTRNAIETLVAELDKTSEETRQCVNELLDYPKDIS